MSLLSAFLCTFIWGTTFIAQDTGMDTIGPLTFNGTRIFIGFLSIIPFALIFEKKKIVKEIKLNKKLSRTQIREMISGNYCRCTGYQAIVDAIEDSVNKLNLGSKNG